MSSLLKAMADTFDTMTAAGTGRVGEFNTGCYEEIGNRPTLEDRVVAKELHVKALKKRGVERVTFFAVYDGHGGQEASIYLHKHLHSHIEKALDSKEVASAYTKDAAGDAMITRILAEEYPKVDAEFFAKHKAKAMAAGSTAATLLVLDDRIFAANVGDSRVLLSRAGTSICLTEDHKPSLPTEKERIKSRGGFVMKGRVCGELAVSRAFGDFRFKAKESLQDLVGDDSDDDNNDGSSGGVGCLPLVLSDPEFKVDVVAAGRLGDEFFLLACDGLFEVGTNEDAVAFVRAQLVEHGDPARAAHAAATNAVAKGSMDNVSVLVVMLQNVIAKTPNPAAVAAAAAAAAVATVPATVVPNPSQTHSNASATAADNDEALLAASLSSAVQVGEGPAQQSAAAAAASAGGGLGQRGGSAAAASGNS